MKELLLDEKYRPKTIDELIILPRIKKFFENGLTDNVILYGNYGSGKTSLARILIGKYTKDKPYLELNISLQTSIEVLRTKIDDFCSTIYMALDLKSDIKSDSMKYVFLDEFEKASLAFQKAFKAFMEDYSTKNVRFILNTNHIEKVYDGVLSRFVKINFDCQSIEEEKYLKKEFYFRIQNIIAVKENFVISKEELGKLINKNFPDFRQILILLDIFRRGGEITENTSLDIKGKEEFYNKILDVPMKYEDVYNYIITTFGPEKIDLMIKSLGTSFVKYILEKHQNLSEKLFEVGYIITEYTKLLETATDPLILGITVFNKINKIFDQNKTTSKIGELTIDEYLELIKK